MQAEIKGKNFPWSSDRSDGRGLLWLVGDPADRYLWFALGTSLYVTGEGISRDFEPAGVFFHSSSLLLMQKGERYWLKENVVIHTTEERAKQLNLWKDRNWRISEGQSKWTLAFKLPWFLPMYDFILRPVSPLHRVHDPWYFLLTS